MNLEQTYLQLFIFILVGIIFVFAPFVISFLIAPNNPNKKKNSTYECGEIPVGYAWAQYHVRYYFFTLVFLIFDVETIFLFPWAVSIKDLGGIAILEMLLFLLVLFVGFVYAWRKGALEWL